ncbi:hypothetical protein DUNSADRAFT_2779 [Dunaliella salina]|uniref:Encoded protein n=1 Tax=Dunaliella salina TaxID=3046 RepID=A0ABQ7GV57_DUNSA|nr:hypothetical protein DUNSADRAFT_2779 [Dunaliella salina]|eukprot:KAF5838509.1 hypothetical protein DUNSADRAFT_2779 [Dunaliella salina]
MRRTSTHTQGAPWNQTCPPSTTFSVLRNLPALDPELCSMPAKLLALRASRNAPISTLIPCLSSTSAKFPHARESCPCQDNSGFLHSATVVLPVQHQQFHLTMGLAFQQPFMDDAEGVYQLVFQLIQHQQDHARPPLMVHPVLLQPCWMTQSVPTSSIEPAL